MFDYNDFVVFIQNKSEILKGKIEAVNIIKNNIFYDINVSGQVVKQIPLTDVLCLVPENNSFAEKALNIAIIFHQGQFDLGNEPYIKHIVMVGEIVKKKVEVTGLDEALSVAYLHDILEDTDFKVQDLYKIFPDEIVRAVITITRKYGSETYQKYLERLKSNRLARMVKLADLEHNSDFSRIKKLDERDFRRKKKYVNAIKFLEKRDLK